MAASVVVTYGGYICVICLVSLNFLQTYRNYWLSGVSVSIFTHKSLHHGCHFGLLFRSHRRTLVGVIWCHLITHSWAAPHTCAQFALGASPSHRDHVTNVGAVDDAQLWASWEDVVVVDFPKGRACVQLVCVSGTEGVSWENKCGESMWS